MLSSYKEKAALQHHFKVHPLEYFKTSNRSLHSDILRSNVRKRQYLNDRNFDWLVGNKSNPDHLAQPMPFCLLFNNMAQQSIFGEERGEREDRKSISWS